MKSDQLTAPQVKHAKPGRHRDGRGLMLLVKESGSKSWVLRLQRNGTRRDYGLGSADVVSLSQAREKAREARAWVKAGKDPIAEWAKAQRIVPTFRQAAIECHSVLQDGWRSEKHKKQWLSTLEKYAFPVIGNLPVNHVDVAELKSVLSPIWLDKPETASRIKSRMGSVLSYAKAMQWRETDAPLNALSFTLPKQRHARQEKYRNQPSLPYEALPELMGRLGSLPSTMPRLALAFGILTVARTEEIRFGRWSELDLDNAIWELPGTRMKSGNPHTVYLSEQAISILQDVKALGLRSLDDLIFVGATGGAMSNRAMLRVLASLGAETKDGEPASFHGMRSTFKTWWQERARVIDENGSTTFIPEEAVELSLAHIQSDKVMRAYGRSEYIEVRRDLMRRWGYYVTSRQQNTVGIAI